MQPLQNSPDLYMVIANFIFFKNQRAANICILPLNDMVVKSVSKSTLNFAPKNPYFPTPKNKLGEKKMAIFNSF